MIRAMATRNNEEILRGGTQTPAERIAAYHQRLLDHRMLTYEYEGVRMYAVGQTEAAARMRASIACGGDDYTEIEIGPIEVMRK